MGIGFKGFRRGGASKSNSYIVAGIIKGASSQAKQYDCGFKPDYIIMTPANDIGVGFHLVYNSDYSETQYVCSGVSYPTYDASIAKLRTIGEDSDLLRELNEQGFVFSSFFHFNDGEYHISTGDLKFVAIGKRSNKFKSGTYLSGASFLPTGDYTDVLGTFSVDSYGDVYNLETYNISTNPNEIISNISSSYATRRTMPTNNALINSIGYRYPDGNGFYLNSNLARGGCWISAWDVKMPLSDYFITGLDKTTYVYTGNPIEPTVLVSGGLIEDTDYTVTYKNNIHIGTGTVIVKGIGNYTGVMTFNFTIASYQEVAVGTDTFPTSGTKHINVGFKPAYLIITRSTTSPQTGIMEIYSKDYSESKFRFASASSDYAKDENLGGSSVTRIHSIDNDGFTMNYQANAQTFQYIAIPENYGGDVAIGEYTISTSTTTKVTLGFKPKYLATTKLPNSYASLMQIYSEDYSTTKARQAGSNGYASDFNLGGTSGSRLKSIDNDGFTSNKDTSSYTMQYIAVGYKVDISPYINGLKKTSVLYTGSAVTSEVDTDLILGTDYTVEYSNNVNKGTATALIRGIGAYSGTVTLNYEVTDYTVGYGNFPSSGTTHIDLGFKPAYLVITRTTATTTTADMIIYSKDYSTTKCRMAWSSGYAQDSSLPNSNAERLASLDDTGFTVTNGVGRQFQYFAIPESYSGNVAIGIANFSSTESQSVNLGFKPKYLALTRTADASAPETDMHIYSEDYSTTNYRYAASTTYAKDQNLNTTEGARIYSIDNNGFTVNKRSTGTKLQYIALG